MARPPGHCLPGLVEESAGYHRESKQFSKVQRVVPKETWIKLCGSFSDFSREAYESAQKTQLLKRVREVRDIRIMTCPGPRVVTSTVPLGESWTKIAPSWA